MDVKKYLGRIGRLNDEIENKLAERNKLFADAVNPAAICYSERVQSSSSSGNVSKITEKYVDIDRQIMKRIRELEEIISTIEQLDDIEYNVIHKRYVQGMMLTSIANKSGKSYTVVAHAHQDGLMHLQEILDEREKANEK